MKDNGFIFFADVRTSEGFPFSGEEVDIVLNLIEEMDVSEQVRVAFMNEIYIFFQIMWLVLDRDRIPKLRQRFPKMILNSALTTLEDIKNGNSLSLRASDHVTGTLDLINHEWAESNDFIRSFVPYNASTVWTVDTDWLFDQMWCLGVSPVILNNCHEDCTPR